MANKRPVSILKKFKIYLNEFLQNCFFPGKILKNFIFSLMAEVITFNGSLNELNELVGSYSGISVVDMYAIWCRTCQRLGRKLNELAKEQPGVRIVKVDIEENPEIKMYFGVDAIPNIQFLKQDSRLQVLDSYIGDNPEIIKEKIQKLQ